MLRKISYFSHASQPQIHNSNLVEIGHDFHNTRVAITGDLILNQAIAKQASNDQSLVQEGVLIFIRFNLAASSLHCTGIRALVKNSAIDAKHNSQERSPPPKCHPQTRQTILAQIVTWIEERTQPGAGNKSILWLYGPAGAGKSVIAQTIAERFSERALIIVASFFFSQGNEHRGTIKYFVATIAYQMTISIPEMRNYIGKVIAHDPGIFRLSPDVQIKRLILEPFHSFISQMRPHTFPQHRYLVIIDGLDECDGDENQKLILLHIADLIHQLNLPFKFLITSRPEPQIANPFRNDSRLSDITTEFELPPSDEDIRTFLIESFQGIVNKHSIFFSKPWPRETEIDEFVKRSSGYFIYASTIIKFVDNEDMYPPKSLELVLSSASNPFPVLDALYTQILSTVPRYHRPDLMSILEIYISSGYKLRSTDFECLLQLQAGSVHIILRRLHSLFGVTDDWIHAHHASFIDYLENKERSGIFHADSCLGHAKMAKGLLRLLYTAGKTDTKMVLPLVADLCDSICAASCLLNHDTDFLEDLETVNTDVSQALHSCTYAGQPLFLVLDDCITEFNVNIEIYSCVFRG